LRTNFTTIQLPANMIIAKRVEYAVRSTH